ncbi:phosphate/phosphite/phosphonate ABC transporter substrate-binding protein [Variovorax sp. VNK109]|uniref:phosphate/phosphite/phosphonate ABC transporter substrate-binding protein n=1 Tax=Variovorax sp. VNK109 TaxID=3400919 RepID=UPI003C00279F
MSTPVANARMYSATPQVRADWKELLAWVLRRANLDWPVIDYDPPAPLNALWARDDLGIAMMCGLPFSLREAGTVQLVAAPVPSPARFDRKPVYFTDIVVRADSPFQRLEDTFGGTVGYTLADSMSGGVAFRAHLAPYRAQRGSRLYARAVGDLIHARGVIDALDRGEIDVGPLDAYYHELLRHNDPAFASRVRIIASTQPTPIPPLIATASLDDSTLASLRFALQASMQAAELAAIRERLLLAGFAVPDAQDYQLLAAISRRVVPAFEEL